MKRTKGVGGVTRIDPKSFRLVEPLRLDDSFLASLEAEEALVSDALRRGAGELDLAHRLEQRRKRLLAPASDALSRLSFNLGPLDSPEPVTSLSVVWRLSRAYRDMVEREFDALPKHVRTAVRAVARDHKKEEFDYYLEMRAAYYQAGYDDPVRDVFGKIVPAKLLGHDVVFGVHERFADRLAGLESLLNSWSPGLAERTAKEIRKMDAGFVPRFIAPKQGEEHKAPTLSNHAFGMAVDVDAQLNPHIKDRDVIDVLKQVTGFDFGSPLVSSTKGIPEMDRIAQSHTLAQDASHKLQAWLRQWLPGYREAERTGAIHSSFPDADTERNMRFLQRIRKFHSLPDLESWAKLGVQSVPLYLAAAMVALKFRWGGAYQHSKDFMHFELSAQELIPPNSEPRPLDEVLRVIAP